MAEKKYAIADHLCGLRASRGSWVLRENRRFCTKRRFFCNFSLAVERKVEKTLNNNLPDQPPIAVCGLHGLNIPGVGRRHGRPHRRW